LDGAFQATLTQPRGVALETVDLTQGEELLGREEFTLPSPVTLLIERRHDFAIGMGLE